MQIFLDANGLAKVTKAKGFVDKGASGELKVELTNKGIALLPRLDFRSGHELVMMWPFHRY